jgi:3-(3-hydroxy-phenyl)propionate hydroxylase
MNDSQLPVVIVGAGPVGLSLAVGLARRGIAVQVFEKLPELSPEARASTFHPRTLEMLDEWGALDPLLERGYRVDRLQFWERAGHELIAEFDYQAIAHDTPYPFRLQCPQSILTRVLKPYLESMQPGSVHMNHQLVAFSEGDGKVTATFQTPDGMRQVEGRFLCGADGAHSRVRQQLEIPFDGITYHDRFLLVATDLDFSPIYPDMGPVSYIFDPVEWVIVLHLPDVTRIVFRIEDNVSEEQALDHVAASERIRAFTAHDAHFEIKKTSIYSVHQRVAATFRARNVILLGDAAHINNPMGGLGMNSGIHDAYHLIPALVEAMETGSDGLLETYNRLRRDYALNDVQRSTDHHYQDMSAVDPAQRDRRNTHFRAIAADPEAVRRYLLKRSMLDDRIRVEEPS